MTDPIRRLRSLGIALAVLALSAGAVFAAPNLRLASAPAVVAQTTNETTTETVTTTDATTTATTTTGTTTTEATTTEATTTEATTTEATTTEATTTDETTTTATTTEATPPPDTHGALVSAAAKMPTPPGFRNHGAFVSCVAHMNVTLATIDWATVTPAACAAGKTETTNANAAAGKAKGAAGKAKGAAHRAAHPGG